MNTSAQDQDIHRYYTCTWPDLSKRTVYVLARDPLTNSALVDWKEVTGSHGEYVYRCYWVPADRLTEPAEELCK